MKEKTEKYRLIAKELEYKEIDFKSLEVGMHELMKSTLNNLEAHLESNFSYVGDFNPVDLERSKDVFNSYINSSKKSYSAIREIVENRGIGLDEYDYRFNKLIGIAKDFLGEMEGSK